MLLVNQAGFFSVVTHKALRVPPKVRVRVLQLLLFTIDCQKKLTDTIIMCHVLSMQIISSNEL